jgi:hypothetical protein
MNSATKLASSTLTAIPAEAPKLLDEDKKKKEEDNKKERRVIKMVILNDILNFILRAMDMLFWMENTNTWLILFPHLAHNRVDEYGRFLPGILSFIPDFGYFTYILTFTSNFFIFYTFNKNFKEAVVFF